MAQNNIDQVYGSRVGVDLAKYMAEHLLQPTKYTPTADTLKLGGTWMLGVPDIARALSGKGYFNIAGSQDATLSDRMVNPSTPNPLNQGYGRIEQPAVTRKRKADRVNYDPLALAEGQSPKDLGMETEVAEAPLATGDDFIDRLIQIESGGNPNARTGKYRGLGMFGPAEEKRYGIDDTNWNDPTVARNAIKKAGVWLSEEFKKRMGRDPTPGELYLAHQQGAAGGPALLKNPDKPAWEVIRPYYESDYMAKLAVRGNIPNGHALKQIPVENVMAGDFSKLWTSRFDQPKAPNKFAGRMNLGGPLVGGQPEAPPASPMAPAAAPMGDQVAQAFPSGGLPGQPRTVSPNQPMQPGGFQGPYPPARPIESDAQLQAILRSLPPEQRAQYLQNYMERRKPDKFEYPGGEGYVTPNPNGPPNYTNIPKGIQTLNIGGVGIPYSLNQDGTIKFQLPGGGKDFNSIEDIIKWKQRVDREGSSEQGLSEEATKRVSKAITTGEEATKALQLLTEMEIESKSSGTDIPRGPTSGFMLKARQLLDNFGIPSQGTSNAEVLEKLNSFLASKAVQTFSDRGSTFELQAFMRANPGLAQSKEGMELLIDILKQEQKQLMGIRKIAQRMKGEDVRAFDARVDEYYRNNPIIVTHKGKKINTKRIEDQSDIEDLPKGMGFVAPDGTIRYKQ